MRTFVKKTKVTTFLVLIINCLSVSCSKGPIAVRGKVVGFDGKPAALAHVHLTTLEDPIDQAIFSRRVEDDGDFSLQLPEAGPHYLWITAVNHMPLRIPLIGDVEGNVTLSAQLAPYDYRERLDEVQVLGDWNPFGQASELIERRPDGSYRFEKGVNKELVAYQLSGVVKDKRLNVNSPVADSFRYDGKGHYLSLRNVRNKKLKIVFRTEDMPLSADGTARVRFDGNPELQAMAELTVRFDRQLKNYFNAYFEYERAHGGISGFDFNFRDLKEFLVRESEHGRTQLIRQLAALHLPQLVLYLDILTGTSGRERKLEQAHYETIRDLVPPESPLWGFDSDVPLPEAVAYGLPDTVADTFLDMLVSRTGSRKVKATALLAQVKLAAQRGKPDLQAELFKTLSTDYRDVMMSSQYLHVEFLKFDPDNQLAPGRPVPAFEATLLGTSEMVSNLSLQGRYYLMDFWATWCTPCIAEMPYLHAAYQKYKDQNFAILSLSLDDLEQTVHRFRAAKWPMPWMHTILDGGAAGAVNSPIGRSFRDGGRLWSIPRPILIGPDGRILATHFSLLGERLDGTLEKFLGDTVAAK